VTRNNSNYAGNVRLGGPWREAMRPYVIEAKRENRTVDAVNRENRFSKGIPEKCFWDAKKLILWFIRGSSVGRSNFSPKQSVSIGVIQSKPTFLRGSTRVEVFERRKYRSRLSTAGAPARVFLASKEQEMIRMVADGVSPRVIARQLELREIEVRACLASIFEKLAISGRLELLSRKAP